MADANLGDAEATVLRASGARAITGTEVLQSLWGGYGQLLRCRLEGANRPSVIVKLIRWPHERDHPYGWTSDISHERKVRSYRVESAFYERYAAQCTDRCRVPSGLAIETQGDGVFIVFEDLDGSGFAGRRQRVGTAELEACLAWLADFHATFMGTRPEQLWPTGTYWHLETRPEELEALDDDMLRAAAPAIDRALSATRFQTLVHGDAKLANFCFSDDGRRVAAVDFQYVGGGCGMKDVAYFIGSCLDERECEHRAPTLLDRYFELLATSLRKAPTTVDPAAVEADWRPLYPVAWTDFHRFLMGWSPGHWKLHGYSERLAREVLASIDSSSGP
ncbi:MAG: phosphotransferase [Actinomycetota bacterium]